MKEFFLEKSWLCKIRVCWVELIRGSGVEGGMNR
jgi:hypothetical protein